MLAIAVVFDPRYKFQFLEFSYQKLYGSGSAELTKVRDTLFNLFNEYVRVSKMSQPLSSCSQGSNEMNETSFDAAEVQGKQSAHVFKV